MSNQQLKKKGQKSSFSVCRGDLVGVYFCTAAALVLILVVPKGACSYPWVSPLSDLRCAKNESFQAPEVRNEFLPRSVSRDDPDCCHRPLGTYGVSTGQLCAGGSAGRAEQVNAPL